MPTKKTVTINFTPPPLQRLLEYVVEKYSVLQDNCVIHGGVANVERCFNCHKESYAPGGSYQYSCYNYKSVYLIRYLATQVVQIADLIAEHVLSSIDEQPSVSAFSFGGGPGVEALALIDQLRNCDGEYDLAFVNVDYEQSWEPIYRDLSQTLVKRINNIKLTSKFFTTDVTTDFSEGGNNYDVVFLSWILSEVNKDDQPLVLRKARKLARANGYILIIDRTEEDLFANIFDALTKIKTYTLIEYNPKYEKNCGLDFPESSRDFGPKYTCSAAYLVLKKV